MTDYRAELRLLVEAAESFTEPALGHHRPWAKAMDRARAVLASSNFLFDEDWEKLKERLWDRYRTRGHEGGEFMYDTDFDSALDQALDELIRSDQGVPTREQLTWLWEHLQTSRRQLMALRGESSLDDTDYQQFAYSLLRMWGSARPRPIPVAERPIFKRRPFNDKLGRCWCGVVESVDQTGDFEVRMPASWEFRVPCPEDDCVLPCGALPGPQRRGTDG